MAWGHVRSASQLPALLTNYPLKCVSCSFVLVSLYAILSHHTVTSFLGLCEHSPSRASHPAPGEAGEEQQEPHLPQRSQRLCRHLAAQSTQTPTVLTHLSPLRSQRHSNRLVLQHTTEQLTHYVWQPESPSPASSPLTTELQLGPNNRGNY